MCSRRHSALQQTCQITGYVSLTGVYLSWMYVGRVCYIHTLLLRTRSPELTYRTDEMSMSCCHWMTVA